VVAGVVAEFAIAAFHPAYDSFLEQWGSALADSAIALGIVGEVICGRRDARIQTELRNRSNTKLGAAEIAAGKANERAAKLEAEAAKAKFKLLNAEAKLEPRVLSAEERAIIVERIKGKITQKANFVFEQNDKAKAFGWSLLGALQDARIPLSPLPWEMPPGERLLCPVMVHPPGGAMSTSDPLCDALEFLGIRVGKTSWNTLSLKMPTPTPLDIGKVFSPFPAGSALPNDEYIVWVGEYLVADDQAEMTRRFQQAFGPRSNRQESESI
jgi:hypothetical protein